MISLNESCNCRLDNWQSSPTCSVGNTSKSGWNTPLDHYCIDGWDLILFQLNQTIHAMYKDYQAEISADGSVFAAGLTGWTVDQLPLPGAWWSGSFFMLGSPCTTTDRPDLPFCHVLATILNSFSMSHSL